MNPGFGITSLIFLLSPFTLYAQEAQVRPVISGFVFDALSSSIRPMVGVPGAALLGPGVVADADNAEIAPDGNQAIVSKGARVYLLSGLRNGDPVWTPVLSGVSKFDQIRWNSASTTAAVYSSDAGALTLLRNRGGALEESAVDLSPVGAAIGAFLVDRDGRYAIATTASEPAALYLLARDASPKLIAQFDRPGPMSLAGNERDLLVADVARRQLVLIRDVFGNAEAQPFSALPDGVDAPVGVAVSQDEARAFVADKASKTLLVYDISTRSVMDRIPLDTGPSFVKRFSRNSLFLLNESTKTGTPIQLLNTDGKPSVYFVPAGGSESQ